MHDTFTDPLAPLVFLSKLPGFSNKMSENASYLIRQPRIVTEHILYSATLKDIIQKRYSLPLIEMSLIQVKISFGFAIL
jgi:hypothetical protein